MIIARRQLLIVEKGKKTPVSIQLKTPRESASNHWVCDYEIGWPEGTHKLAGHGADAMQALIIALQMIGAELYASAYHKNGSLRSEDQKGGYGFPVAANCRDLLVGEDKTYF
jgi:hypothetical protein